MPRTLISDDGATRTWEITDAQGKVVGTDRERVIAPGSREDTERVLRDRAAQAIAAMQTHIDRGTFTNAQRDAALLLCLRVNVALARLALNRLEAS